ncbi:NADH-quinone oxidoreductase subunit G [Candidatus Providencia siddallii]|uniref:NADH-quinone oxidoreductase subunit G n=1 Tax=Candidatus Providencia siddallii TaxID=1715285 RepID=A0A0M6W7R5_9GAMM|nr:NADH-quinone oxidoreductase subunit G [Candidatus Providencia siddallii]
MAVIYVDNRKFYVNNYENLLHACLSLGLDIPYFCWHPALGSIGSCRQCAVKEYKNVGDVCGYIIMSCMTQVRDGLCISINDEETKEFRKTVIECLMINHPHDCLVCDEGGNCHLQDMTVMTGHYKRNYRFNKRTHINQNLGPFINHEMNRCIACYRCINFYKNYAGGTDLYVYGIHDNVYFGRVEHGMLKNEFSGNLIEVCPTGVFTDKTYSEHYNRKWDIQFAPSICHQCSIGCNIIIGERNGKICKIENRYNGSVNRYFLCDRGRFGCGYINCEDRPRQAFFSSNNIKEVMSNDKAIKKTIQIFNKAKKIIGIGSSRASIETNYMLRLLVGEENFYSGISEEEQLRLTLILNILQHGGVYTPMLREIEEYNAILVLGEDLTQTSARMALSVRRAVKLESKEAIILEKTNNYIFTTITDINIHNKNVLIVTNVDKTCLEDIAFLSYYAPVVDQARFGFAIAHAINKKSPIVNDLSISLKNKIDIIAKIFIESKKVLIISGTHSASDWLIKAAANIAFALKDKGVNVALSYLSPNANSFGLAMMNAKSIDRAFNKIELDEVDAAIVVENDLYCNSKVSVVDTVITKLKYLIVIDHYYTNLMDKSTIGFPAATFAESNGTLISQEGRAQRFFKVFKPSFYDNNNFINESWRWLCLINSELNKIDLGEIKFDNIISDCAINMPQFAKIIDASPKSSFRIRGQKIARESHRYSGRTAILSNKSIHEAVQPQDFDSPFVFSMEGNISKASLTKQIPFAWVPGWNSVQSWNKFQNKVGGYLLFGDPGIRLFDSKKSKMSFFTEVPKKYQSKKNQWIIVPYYHLFGSEEMSQRSDIVKQCMPKPYIVFNNNDALLLDLTAESKIELLYDNQLLYLNVRLSDKLSTGQIGLPLGMYGFFASMTGILIKNSIRKVE